MLFVKKNKTDQSLVKLTQRKKSPPLVFLWLPQMETSILGRFETKEWNRSTFLVTTKFQLAEFSLLLLE